MMAVALKLEAAQRDKLQALGGEEWVQGQIDAAKLQGNVQGLEPTGFTTSA